MSGAPGACACRDEHAALLEIAAAERAAARRPQLEGRGRRGARSGSTQLGNPYSVVAVDREGRTAIDFGVYGAPETFFIDADGRVQYRHVGAMTPEVWQREFLARLPRGGLP